MKTGQPKPPGIKDEGIDTLLERYSNLIAFVCHRKGAQKGAWARISKIEVEIKRREQQRLHLIAQGAAK